MKNLLPLLLLLFASTLFAETGFVEPWGKDRELVKRREEIENAHDKRDILVKAAEQIILFHQNVISPVDGPRSDFKPSSSNYMLFAIKRHGFVKGFVMGCDRLLRENKEEWVYRTTIFDGEIWKWDPVPP